MKLGLILPALLLISAAAAAAAAEPKVYFSPNGGCEQEIVNLIDGSKVSVHVQAYGFTSKPIADALIRAKTRGEDVSVLLDKSNLKVASEGSRMASQFVQVLYDRKHAIAHNKVVIVDGKLVETGSFNFTHHAEKSNAENCLFLDDARLASVYEGNWLSHHAHSGPR